MGQLQEGEGMNYEPDGLMPECDDHALAEIGLREFDEELRDQEATVEEIRRIYQDWIADENVQKEYRQWLSKQ